MKEIYGKECPFCKTIFTTKDDIVICQICEMPHHKDCWAENQGCTTFGCTGKIKTWIKAWEDVVFCPECGYKTDSSSVFCEECGAKI